MVELDCATRYGDVRISATGFVDATGDAALAWNAGFACREPEGEPVYGTQMVILENIDEAKQPTKQEISDRMKEKAESYGLLRREGLAFIIPGRGVAAMNMTHIETPLEPLAASKCTLEGKDQADRAVKFLREEFPACFGNAKVRAYGFPGIRQTRWIVGRQQLTRRRGLQRARVSRTRSARTAWPIELHYSQGHHWHTFGEEHVHYIPLGELDAGRSRQRRRGRPLHRRRTRRRFRACASWVRASPWGRRRRTALDLAGTGSVHQIDIAALRERLYDNIDRVDPAERAA